MDDITRAHFDAVVARILDDELEPGDGAWLAELLQTDPEATREISGLLTIDDLLRQRAEPDKEAFAEALKLRLSHSAATGAFVERVRRSIVPVPPARFRWAKWVAAAAAIVLIGIFAVKLLPLQKQKEIENVAVLTKAVAAEWQTDVRQIGQGLAPGWFRLKAGAVQIEFSRGARVILEAPAEVQLISANEAYVKRGKLRAVVPEAASGFKISGDGFSVVDRGTEFGCLVSESSFAEVHVLEGHVDFLPVSKSPMKLAKAEAIRYSPGRIETIPTRPELFLSDEAFARLKANEASGHLAVWHKASAAIDAHQAAVVHYDFEQVRSPARTLPNQVRGHNVPAAIVGCQPAEGRWPGKGALAFDGPDDRLRFTLAGELQTLTLMTWVRIDDLPNIQSSLIMAESDRAGDLHWYLHRDGTFGLAIVARDGQWRAVHSPRLLNRGNFGTWIFLAATFDSSTSTVTLYFNGKPVASEVAPAAGPVRLQPAEIGNWGIRATNQLHASRSRVKDQAGLTRYLHGQMDEFALFSAVLSAEEIEKMYESGKPNGTL